MKKNKWLVASILMAVVLIFVGCAAPQVADTNEIAAEELRTEEVNLPEEVNADVTMEEVTLEAEQPVVVKETTVVGENTVVTETPAVMDRDLVLGMLYPDAILAKDEIAPDFALKNLEGEVVQLSDYRGKLVLLNFWTTW